jgi:hypothetical protein
VGSARTIDIDMDKKEENEYDDKKVCASLSALLVHRNWATFCEGNHWTTT